MISAVQIGRISGLADAFHRPFTNNYVHVLVPCDRDLDAFVRGVKQRTAPLNRADAAVLAACAELLGPTPADEDAHALRMWRDCIARRVNLAGVRWASELGARLGPRLVAYLREHHPETLDSLRRVPIEIQHVVRVNGYLPSAQIDAYLERVASVLRAGLVPLPIERVEVARLREPVLRPAFPTAIVYLDAATVSAATVAEIEITLGVFSGLLEALQPTATPRTELALPLTHNATLTEGFTLYKRYLALVDLLDEIYDPAFGHALARGSRLGALSV